MEKSVKISISASSVGRFGDNGEHEIWRFEAGSGFRNSCESKILSLSLSSRSVHCSDSRVRVFRSDLYSAIKKKKKGKNRPTLVFGFGFVFFGFE